MRRIAGVLRHPRSTMADLVAAPSWLTAWAVIVFMWLLPAGWLLSTPTGRQALIDERVRQVEAFGGRVDDAAYARLRATPPWSAYFTSGGRLLLAPPITLLVAGGLVLLARMDRSRMSLAAALSVTVHASAVLALQQLVATPLHYLRESLTSPTSLSTLVSPFNEGTLGARVVGAVDVFALWWLWLLALGVGAATGRPAGRYAARLLVVLLGVAAGLAVVTWLSGGS